MTVCSVHFKSIYIFHFVFLTLGSILIAKVYLNEMDSTHLEEHLLKNRMRWESKGQGRIGWD